MSSGWDRARERAKKGKSGKYWTLDDGKRAAIAFLGEPRVLEEVWNDGIGEYEEPSQPNDPHAQDRYWINVWNAQLEKVQVLKTGIQLFGQVLKLRVTHSVEDYYFIVTRRGTGRKTNYKVTVGERIPDHVKQQFKILELHDLYETDTDPNGKSSETQDTAVEELGTSPADSTIDRDTVEEITRALQRLPTAALHEFLTSFGLKRVSEINQSQREQALALVIELVRRHEITT